MMMIREETRMLMTQFRRSFSSRGAGMAGAAVNNVAAPKASASAPAAVHQQRHHLNVSPASTSTSRFDVSMLSSMLNESTARTDASSKMTTPHQLLSCEPINGGRQLVVEFADESRYELHSGWLRDSSPSNMGADFYRTSAADVWKLSGAMISGARPEHDGDRLTVHYDVAGSPHTDVFETRWLHAFAPYVGKALHSGASTPAPLKGTASLLDSLHVKRTPWMNDVEMPTFDAATLINSQEAQVDFLERMVDPGIALITGMGTPESLEREYAGKPLEDFVEKTIGRMNQHPVRSTRYGVMRKTAESAKQGSDYDMSNPLSMHTDHSVYQGTPGYLQFLYQAQGSVTSKVCDGLALVEHVRENHPEAYKLLTTVEITHSSRNNLYSKQGAPRDVRAKGTEAAPFELVHTHPIIQLDAQGLVEKVVQSETKRGVCALPYHVYEPFMEAYELWTQLCEDARFIKNFHWPEGTAIVTNNWRTLHGRASVPPGMERTMCFGYVNKILVENRYRLLKQNQTERANPAMGSQWLTRVPNQVLEKIAM